MSPTWTVELDRGSLSLASGAIRLESIQGWCRLAGGSMATGKKWRQGGGVLTCSCGPLQLRLTIEPDEDRVVVSLGATATSAATVEAIGLVCQVTVESSPPIWVIHNGYQSWDAAGHAPVAGSDVASWWTIAMAGDGGDAVALAATEPGDSITSFLLRHDRLTWSRSLLPPPGLGLDLWPGKSGNKLGQATIAIAVARDPLAALDAATPELRPTTSASVPRGWLSWYQLGPWVDRDQVVTNAGALATDPWQAEGYRVVQVDDGWQMSYGDWRPNAKFQPDFAGLASALHAQGQRLGVWTAPFLVSISSDLSETAPEHWFLHDPTSDARLVDPRHVALGPMLVLDLAQEEVREHLEAIFTGLRGQGIEYFKIDFLYAGAYSGIEHLRTALGRIRSATTGAYLLACGAPLLAVAGIADGCRIGIDTATPVYDFDLDRAEAVVFGHEVRSIARNLAFRHHLRRWFQLDADVALVGQTLSVPEARQLVSLVALSGGPFFAADRLTELAVERTALLTNPEILGLTGGDPAAPAWEPNPDDLPPAVWHLREPDGSLIIGLFDWELSGRQFKLPVPGAWQVRDLWHQTDCGPVQDVIEIRLGGDGAGIFRISPEPRTSG